MANNNVVKPTSLFDVFTYAVTLRLEDSNNKVSEQYIMQWKK